MGADFDASWALIAGGMTAAMSSAQLSIARDSFKYIPEVLEDTGMSSAIDTSQRFSPSPFVGVTGTGIAVDQAMFTAVITAKIGMRDGATIPQALKLGETRLMQTAQLALADTGRQAERVAMAPRKIAWYTRVLTLPSCSRCVILAGRKYRSEQAFQRHPRCDCVHQPLPPGEDAPFSPSEYFDSLTPVEQDKAFGRAGAEAIRNGADMNQVVNARRGMYTAADGRKYTREGVTRRGYYNITTRAGRNKRARFMPEELQAMAKSKVDYLSLLKSFGYFV